MKRLTYTTSYESEINLEEASGEAVVLSAVKVVNELGWQVKAIAPAGLLIQTTSEEIVVWIWDGQIRIKSISTDDRVHDWGQNRKNIQRLIENFRQSRATVPEIYPYDQFEELKQQYPYYEDAGLLPYGAAWYKKEKAASGFLFTKGFMVTPALILLNILMFMVMCIGGADIVDPGAQAVAQWGGNFGPYTLNGEWWRIISCQFVHIGVIHLLANMLALFFFGSFMETLLGWPRFLAAYLLSGICASLLSLYMHPGTVSAGASGAIFGLMGVFLSSLTLGLTDRATTRALLPNFAIYIIYSLFSGLKEGIDNAGHLGGLIGGMLIGYVFLPGLKKNFPRKRQYLVIFNLTLVIIIIIFITFSLIPNNIR